MCTRPWLPPGLPMVAQLVSLRCKHTASSTVEVPGASLRKPAEFLGPLYRG